MGFAARMAMLNVFVIGVSDGQRPLFESLPIASNCRFHRLLDGASLRNPRNIPIRELLKRARSQLDEFDQSIDAITGYWDFPVSCMVPILCAERGLASPPLDGVLRCEHKFWSRVLQREVIPEHVPRFAAVDPFENGIESRPPLPFPFWLKPIKSFNAYLGFRIDDEDKFSYALPRIRAGISALGDPFDFALEKVERPSKIRGVGGSHCIAEEIISTGRQCTAEGYVHGEDVVVFGIVDSLRVGSSSTFARYQYPSRLPAAACNEMMEISRRVIRHIGLLNSHFNIEYYWHEDSGQYWLLEINPRISQSHSQLFADVDGVANHAVSVDLALGRRPEFPHRKGPYACAAKFFLRRTRDAVVTRVPSPRRMAEIEHEVGGVKIELEVEEGTRLSDLGAQESYSYELAWIYVGGADEQELLRKHETVVGMMDIRLERVHGEAS